MQKYEKELNPPNFARKNLSLERKKGVRAAPLRRTLLNDKQIAFSPLFQLYLM
jgi:hypothetical protein